MMRFKKAQITVFIIIGITLIIAASFVYISYSSKESEKQKTEIQVAQEVPVEKDAIYNYVTSCLASQSYPLIKRLAYEGGLFNDSLEKIYDEVPYTYLCTNDENYGCVNRVVSRRYVEAQLDQEIKALLPSCILLEQFKEKGYKIETGEMKVTTSIGLSDVIVKLEYPMTFTKGDYVLEIDQFSSRISTNFGYLLDLANEILSKDIAIDHEGLQEGIFDQARWMAEHGDFIHIRKHKPYPDMIYSLSRYDKERNQFIEFNFAVQGKNTQQYLGSEENILDFHGFCQSSEGLCFYNTPEALCTEQGLKFSSTKPTSCRKSLAPIQKMCNGVECNDCGNRKHGESWCEYDALAGQGFDYVGSRHYKKVCINGIIYTEECRDYREELCTETIDADTDFTEAICRVNRWETCYKQTSKENCEDNRFRDCAWEEGLAKESRTETTSFSPSTGKREKNTLPRQRNCHPEVPPGFRHWEFSGFSVCQLANDWTDCDGASCHQVWSGKRDDNLQYYPDSFIDNGARYCYFMGDCGNYRNIADDFTAKGFFGTDQMSEFEGEIEEIYPKEGLTAVDTDYRLDLPLDTIARFRLKGNELSNPENDVDAILQVLSEYTNEVTTWSKEDFIKQYIKKQKINYYTRHMNFCSVWQAPDNDNNCGLCAKDLDKPCTEYKCKSLGRCNYEEVNGIGICSGLTAQDSIKPTIGIELPDDSPYELEESIFDDITGYEISPEVQPYEVIEIKIKTNKPTQCKLFYFPRLKYNFIPEMSTPKFATEHNITIRVKSLEGIEVMLERMLGMFSLLQLDNLAYMESMFEEMKEDAEKISKEFDQDVTKTKDKISSIETRYKLTIKPFLSSMYNIYGRYTDRILIDLNLGSQYMFVKCIDTAGQETEQETFIKMNIGEDETPPKILRTSPKNDSKTGSVFSLIAYLDEPSVCKFSEEDISYDEMDDYMLCDNPESTFLMKEFRCVSSLQKTDSPMDIYISCKDQPAQTHKIRLNIMQPAIPTAQPEVSAEDLLPKQVVIEGDALIVKDIKSVSSLDIQMQSFELKLRDEEQMECRYSDSGLIDYDEMEGSFSCKELKAEDINQSAYKYECSADMQAPAQEDTDETDDETEATDAADSTNNVYVACTSPDRKQPNMMEKNYHVRFY